MKVNFHNRHLKELYEKKKSKKYQLQEHLIKKYIRTVDFIMASDNTAALYSMKSYNFELLKGYKNRYSLRLNNKYRLEVEIDWTNDTNTVGIFGIEEISKHYE